MGGIEAQRGFRFQAFKALLRLLKNAVESSRCEALGEPSPPPLRVRIEKPVIADSGSKDTAWDAVYFEESRVVVEECKLGNLSAEHRRTLYERIRAQVHCDPKLVGTLEIRITTGEKGAASTAKWREVKHHVHDVACPTTPPAAESAVLLAEEALYYLTTREPLGPAKRQTADSAAPPPRLVLLWLPPLMEHDARALLSRIVVDDEHTLEELEEEIGSRLAAIGSEDSQQVLTQVEQSLRGWMDQHATHEEVSDLTIDTLLSIVGITSHYLNESAQVKGRWQVMRRAKPVVRRPPAHARGEMHVLRCQPWREVQPWVASSWPPEGGARWVLNAVGGTGKSVLLADLYDELPSDDWVRIWIDTVGPLESVERALTWGAWATRLHKKRLAVFIDSIEHAKYPSMADVHDGSSVLSMIHTALNDPKLECIVIASCRRATWAVIEVKLAAWRGLQLSPWSPARVQSLLLESGISAPSASLVDLLRTPFLLDLYVKSVNEGGAMVEGVSSRHGLLREYFRLRVIPETPSGGQARRALNKGVVEVLAGRSQWLDIETGVDELVSEGVLERVSGDGSVRFRHALLRDFCMALELSASAPEEIASKLAAMRNPLDLEDAVRALVERQLDEQTGSPTWLLQELLAELVKCSIHVGAALGELDAPTPLLLPQLARMEDGEPLLSTIRYLTAGALEAWCRLPPRLGLPPPAWLSGKPVRAMGCLAANARAPLVDAQISSDLARTLRSWTSGYDLTKASDVYEAAALANIGGLLVRDLPDAETAAWFAKLRYRKSQLRSSFGKALVELVECGHEISDDALLTALRNLALGEDDLDMITADTLLPIPEGCAEGLWSRYPVAVRWCLTLSLASRQPASVQVSSNLVNDAGESWGTVYEALEHAVELAREDEVRAGQLCDAARGSASLRGRLAALSLSIDGEDPLSNGVSAVLTGALQPYVEPILADAGIYRAILDCWSYHLDGKARLLWRALHGWWPQLSNAGRTAIQRFLRDLPRENELTSRLVAQWATAVPPSDRGAELTAMVEALEQSGAALAPVKETQIYVESDVWPARKPALDRIVPMGEPHASACRKLRDLCGAPDVQGFAAIDQQLSRMLAEGLFAGDPPPPLWCEVLSALESTYTAVGPEKRELSGVQVVEQLAWQTLAHVSRCRGHLDLWGAHLAILHRCIEIDVVGGGAAVTSLRDALLAEVDRATCDVERIPGARAFVATARVGPSTWRTDRGWQLLQSWARSPCVDLQEVGLGYSLSLRLSGSIDLVREVLEAGNRERAVHASTDAGNAVAELMGSVGRALGDWACTDEGVCKRLDEWLTVQPRAGWLTSGRLWHRLLFGAANACQLLWPRDPGQIDAARRTAFATLLVKLYLSGEMASRGIIDYALWPLRRLHGEAQPDYAIEAWSRRLAPLVYDLAAKGNRYDLLGLAHLRWEEISPDVARGAADALLKRGEAVRQEVAEPLVAVLRELSHHQGLSHSRRLAILGVLLRHEPSTSLAQEAALELRARLRSQA